MFSSFPVFLLKFLCPSLFFRACYMSRPSFSPSFGHPNNIRRSVQIVKVLITRFSPVSRYFHPLGSNILLSLCSQSSWTCTSSGILGCNAAPSTCVLPLGRETKFHTHSGKKRIRLWFCIFISLKDVLWFRTTLTSSESRVALKATSKT
jgi:hypothetical protein